MPPPEAGSLHQKATLWTSFGKDAYGQFKIRPAIEIPVRWVESREREIDNNGRTVMLLAKVVVDRDIPEGSLMWLGEEEDWVGTGFNSRLDGPLGEVARMSKIPDVKGRYFFREVVLYKFRDGELPTIVPED